MIGMIAFDQMFSAHPHPFEKVLKASLIAAGVFGFCLVADQYASWAKDVVMTGLTRSLAQAIAAGVDAPAVDGHAFDALAAKAFATGGTLLLNVGWSPLSWILAIVVLLFWTAALIGITVCFIAFLVPHVMLYLLIAIGPVCCALAAFPVFRQWFWSWLRVCLGMVLLQFMVVAALGLLLAGEDVFVRSILAANQDATGSTAGNVAEQALSLFLGSAVYLIGAYVAVQLPSLAQAISGGAYTQISSALSPASALGRMSPPSPPSPPQSSMVPSPALPPPAFAGSGGGITPPGPGIFRSRP
jgi:hypothetical protein